MNQYPQQELFGCQFDYVTMGQAVETCVEWCKGPRESRIVLTANAGVLCAKRRDELLEEACRASDMVVPDGMAVVWASRLLGRALPTRVAGVDFMVELLVAASRHDLSIYLLGAKPEIVAKLAAQCRADGVRVAGFRDGYFAEADHAAIVEEIRERRPDFLFVGMPSPFKEVWCQRHRERLNVPVIMGVGGSFDVLVGHVRRAPRWVQSVGMEWSWRLAMEPRKMWKRYLTTNSEFIWITAGLVAKNLFSRTSRPRSRSAP